jgi:hypothetical protein
MKKLPSICLLSFLGIFCACNKPKPVAPEIEFEIHDTIEYYYDGEIKGRIICMVDCELPVDTVWWHEPGDGFEGEYSLMKEQDGKYIYVIGLEFDYPVGLELDYNYRLSIGGWRYSSDWYKLHVPQPNQDSVAAPLMLNQR